MNTISYIIYLSITSWITIVVGSRLHKNGYWYIIDLFNGDEAFTESVNKLLLVGYYLLNIGYLAATISHWSAISTIQQMMETIIRKVGVVTIALAIIHYCNMTILMLFAHYQKRIKTQINLHK
jgi:hypothetical protein